MRLGNPVIFSHKRYLSDGGHDCKPKAQDRLHLTIELSIVPGKAVSMSATALAKLNRAIEDLERAVAGTRRNHAEALALKSELEAQIQRIDELRQKL